MGECGTTWVWVLAPAWQWVCSYSPVTLELAVGRYEWVIRTHWLADLANQWVPGLMKHRRTCQKRFKMWKTPNVNLWPKATTHMWACVHTETHRQKYFLAMEMEVSSVTAEEVAAFWAPFPCVRQASNSPAEDFRKGSKGSMLLWQCSNNMQYNIWDSKCHIIGSDNVNEFRMIIFPSWIHNLLRHLEKK